MPARGYGWWTFEQKGRGLLFFYWFSTNYEMTFFLCQVSSNSGLCWRKGDVQRDVCSSEVHASHFNIISTSAIKNQNLTRDVFSIRDWAFMMFAISNFLTSLGYPIPYTFVPVTSVSYLYIILSLLSLYTVYEMNMSSFHHHYCVHLKDNAQKLGLTAVQGSYLVGLIGQCQN